MEISHNLCKKEKVLLYTLMNTSLIYSLHEERLSLRVQRGVDLAAQTPETSSNLLKIFTGFRHVQKGIQKCWRLLRAN